MTHLITFLGSIIAALVMLFYSGCATSYVTITTGDNAHITCSSSTEKPVAVTTTATVPMSAIP